MSHEEKKDQIEILAAKDGGKKMIYKRGSHMGFAEKIEEGKPIGPGGEIVHLKESDEGFPTLDVIDSYAIPEDTGSLSGPPKANSRAFREGWDNIDWGDDVGPN